MNGIVFGKIDGRTLAELPVTDLRHVLETINADRRFRENMEMCRIIKNRKNHEYWLRNKKGVGKET